MRIFTTTLLASFIFAVPVPLGPDVYAQTKGSPPIVNFSYAQEKIRQGEIWKIYLSVSDPEGDMSRIVCTIEQDGAQRYRPSVTYLKKGMDKGFSGYLALYTSSPRNLSGEDFTLKATIIDRAGNERKTIRFPLEFNGESMRPFPRIWKKT